MLEPLRKEIGANESDPLLLLEDYSDVSWLVDKILKSGGVRESDFTAIDTYFISALVCIVLDTYEFRESIHRFRMNVVQSKNNECQLECLHPMALIQMKALEIMAFQFMGNGLEYSKRLHRYILASGRRPDSQSPTVAYWSRFVEYSEDERAASKDRCTKILEDLVNSGAKKEIFRIMSEEKLSWGRMAEQGDAAC